MDELDQFWCGDGYIFSFAEVAQATGKTKRQAIEWVNALEAEGQLKFVGAIEHLGGGDYLVKYL